MRKREKRSAFLLSMALIVVVSGCATLEVRLEYPSPATGNEQPPAHQQATRTRPSTAAPTATSPPTSVPGPTSGPATPTATSTTLPEPQRIQFAEGATSATVTGTLPIDGSDRYVVRALAGQALSVDITAPHPVLLGIWRADGRVLKRTMEGTTYWDGSLPSTGDYVLELTSTGPQIDYHLTVTIPKATAPLPDLEASTYRNQVHGFEVHYPGDFAEGMTCPTEGIIDDPVVSFRLVGASYYSGTNLLDACVTVGVDPSQAARVTCREARDLHEEMNRCWDHGLRIGGPWANLLQSKRPLPGGRGLLAKRIGRGRSPQARSMPALGCSDLEATPTGARDARAGARP